MMADLPRAGAEGVAGVPAATEAAAGSACRFPGVNRWFFAGIVLVNLAVFLPMFGHVFRNDDWQLFHLTHGLGWLQLPYFADMSLRTGFVWIFRPLGGLILGIQRLLFGPEYFLYHCLGFISHMVVVWLLLRLMLTFQGGPLAYGFALLYSLMVGNFDCVAWLTSYYYVVQTALILAALVELREQLVRGPGRELRGGPILLALGLSVFLTENGAVFALVLAAFGLAYSHVVHGETTRFRPIAVRLSALAAFYVVLFVGHGLVVLQWVTPERGSAVVAAQTLPETQHLGTVCLVQVPIWVNYVQKIFMPASVGCLASRSILHVRLLDGFSGGFSGLVNSLAVVAVFGGFLRLGRIYGDSAWPDRGWWIGLFLVMGVLSVLTVTAGRVSTYGLGPIMESSRYMYFFNACAMLLFMAVLGTGAWDSLAGMGWRRATLCGVLLLAVLHGWQSFNGLSMISRVTADVRSYFDAVRSFVREHAREPDLSICMLTPPPPTRLNDTVHLVYCLDGFFRHLTDYYRPKYLLRFDADLGRVVPVTAGGSASMGPWPNPEQWLRTIGTAPALLADTP